MIYFDNAATTKYKPEVVYEATNFYLRVRLRNKAKPIRRRAVLDGTDAANHTMIQQRT